MSGMNEESTAISLMNGEAENFHSYSCEAMATTFQFYLAGASKGLVDSAAMEAEELLGGLESQLSLYIEHSDTSRINRALEGEEIAVSQVMVDCLLEAFDASSRLAGLFDPFLGQLAIDAKGQRPILPHLKGIETSETASEGPVISLDPDANRVRKLRYGPLLDLGGIGKGFALDRLCGLFQNWDIDSGLLNSGGSTFLALNTNADGKKWTLNIGYGTNLCQIELAPGFSIASSGELFQESHIINPADAPPLDWKRSYAISRTAALADASSTAGLLLGENEVESMRQEEGDLSFALFTEGSARYFGPFFKEDG